ncbi:MAG: TIGR00730 family Rossman fold protein [bacterium]
MSKDTGSRVFPSANEDAKKADTVKNTAQTRSASYRLAYADEDFLLRDELRPVRLQLELYKPELILKEKGIDSTIVVFGSSRILDPKKARSNYNKAKSKALEAPSDPELARQVEISWRRLEKSRYYEAAREFAHLISSSCQNQKDYNYVIITGGGQGIMGAANRGAHDAGKMSIGLNIVLPTEQAPNQYITPELCFQFHYFAIRKMHFLMRAKALVIFPGGFGTLDELFDALTLIQTKKIKPIPVLLFGKEYWKRVLDFDVMLEEGMIDPEDLKIFKYVETAQEAFDIINDFYGNSRA